MLVANGIKVLKTTVR